MKDNINSPDVEEFVDENTCDLHYINVKTGETVKVVLERSFIGPRELV